LRVLPENPGSPLSSSPLHTEKPSSKSVQVRALPGTSGAPDGLSHWGIRPYAATSFRGGDRAVRAALGAGPAGDQARGRRPGAGRVSGAGTSAAPGRDGVAAAAGYADRSA